MYTIDQPTNQKLHEIDQQYYLPTFKRYPIAFSHGEGARLWDVEGNEYLDVLAGIAVNNLGHCHPTVVKAVQQQAARLMHISNFYVSEPQVLLSKELVERSGMDHVFFSNSGAESVEGAIKIARKYAHSIGRGGEVISMKNSFHGRTLATIATGKKKMQQGFDPIPSGFRQVPFNDIEAVRAAISKETAAIILEPVQGEGGIHPAKPCYLRALRELCSRENIVLIFDEIQCGVGRTGTLFAKDQYEVQPDIMTLAKGLGSGMVIGAILSNQKVGAAIEFGDHGTTFGGNPMACTAGLATLQAFDEENILKEVARKGELLRTLIEKSIGQHPGFLETRGLGLMLGVVFDFETKPLVAEMLNRRVLANATAGNVLRLVPPLNISDSDLTRLAGVIEAALETVQPKAIA